MEIDMKGANNLNINNYSIVVFEHTETEHQGEMETKAGVCRYFYFDADPIWYMAMSADEANEMFESGEFKLVSVKRLVIKH